MRTTFPWTMLMWKLFHAYPVPDYVRFPLLTEKTEIEIKQAFPGLFLIKGKI